MKWPGDMLTVLATNLVTAEMLGLQPNDQQDAYPMSRDNNVEGRAAAQRIEIARKMIREFFKTQDLDPETRKPRWVPEPARTYQADSVKAGAKDGTPDDFLRLLDANFEDFFTNMQLFNPRTIGAQNTVILEKTGYKSQEAYAERFTLSAKYRKMKAWAEGLYPTVSLEVTGSRGVIDLPNPPRNRPPKSIREQGVPETAATVS